MYVNISVSNSEIRAAMKKIEFYDGKTRLKLEKAIDLGTKAMARKARSKVPVGYGTLKNSIFSSFKKERMAGYFGARKPHAHLLELGVKSSVVKPKKRLFLKNRRYLRFFNSGGDAVFIRKAVIPARRAQPFIKPAYEEEEPKLIARVRKAVEGK